MIFRRDADEVIRDMMQPSVRRALVWSLFSALVVLGLVLAPDGALAGMITVTPWPPVPMQPMEVTVTGEPCDPFASVEVRLERSKLVTDTVDSNPLLLATVQTDANGDFSATITTTAYPGFWMTKASCGSDPFSFSVPDIPGMVMSVSPSSVVAGSTVSITVSGAECPGHSAYWHIGPVPNQIDSGFVSIGSDGAWSVTATID